MFRRHLGTSIRIALFLRELLKHLFVEGGVVQVFPFRPGGGLTARSSGECRAKSASAAKI